MRRRARAALGRCVPTRGPRARGRAEFAWQPSLRNPKRWCACAISTKYIYAATIDPTARALNDGTRRRNHPSLFGLITFARECGDDGAVVEVDFDPCRAAFARVGRHQPKLLLLAAGRARGHLAVDGREGRLDRRRAARRTAVLLVSPSLLLLLLDTGRQQTRTMQSRIPTFQEQSLLRIHCCCLSR